MTDTLAFAGAEGFGASTVGGRGGDVVTVTNLNDSGYGSLRWALQDVSGPRTVVFAVSGAIELKTQILIEHPNVTIAGQTAPGEGIVIEGARIRVDASEVIARGLHFRPGDGAAGMAYDDRDAFFIGSTDNVVNNVVVDHNSFEWSIDQNISATGRVQNITISNNIIAQGLSESLHSKGEHSKGAGSGSWTVTDPFPNNHISYVKNLMADNTARNPEFGTGAALELVNNYIFNWGHEKGATYLGSTDTNTATAIQVNVVGNVYEAGLDTLKPAKGAITIGTIGGASAIYLQDNLQSGKTTDSAGNQVQSGLVNGSAASAAYLTAGPAFGSSAINVLDSKDVRSYVLANAGAKGMSGLLDAIDQRIISGVSNGSSRIVDSVAQAGGKAASVPVAPPVDTDHDGMPNWFEDLYGFDSKVADHNGDSDRDGFTNLEEYINGLITGFDLPAARSLTTMGLVSGKVDKVVADASWLTAPRLIANFDAAGGDTLDLRPLLSGVTSTTNLADYLNVTIVAGNAVVTVDADGLGNGSVSRLVGIVSGASQLTAAKLLEAVGVYGSNTTAPPTVVPVIREFRGTSKDDALVGSADADRLFGLDGNDKLDGRAGADTMTGGRGNDAYTVDNVGDVIVELSGEGDDKVTSTVTYTLSANVESLYLVGTSAISGTGNEAANRIDGNDAANVLTGGAGDDQLYGKGGDDRLIGGDGNDKLSGGTGTNILDGGAGDDQFFVDSTSDLVIENAGGGTDRVTSTVTHTLAENVENLTLGGTLAIDGTGNGADNVLVGNAADNVLRGLGGADNITGGAGNDKLYGGDGNDRLSGGPGNDFLDGGAGDDFYFIDDLGDTVVEAENGGTDNVNASVSVTLSANVEHLLLTGTSAVDGTGNALNNKLTGNAADNVLSGMSGIDTINGAAGNDRIIGGTGADKLTGGAGSDTFVFNLGDSGTTAATADLVTDFQRGVDKIDLDFVNGHLAASDFAVGWTATTSIAAAYTAAQGLMADGTKHVVFVANKVDGWLFWNNDSDLLPDEGVQLTKLGAASLAGATSIFSYLDVA